MNELHSWLKSVEMKLFIVEFPPLAEAQCSECSFPAQLICLLCMFARWRCDYSPQRSWRSQNYPPLWAQALSTLVQVPLHLWHHATLYAHFLYGSSANLCVRSPHLWPIMGMRRWTVMETVTATLESTIRGADMCISWYSPPIRPRRVWRTHRGLCLDASRVLSLVLLL